jgi:hypothetical protein
LADEPDAAGQRRLLRDGLRHPVVVACHHDEALNAVRSQLLHCGHRVGAQYVGDGEAS